MSELAEDVPVNDGQVIRENQITEDEATIRENRTVEDEAKQDDPAESDDEVIVTIGDAAPAEEEETAQEPGVLNKVRKELRHKEREIKRLQKELEAKNQPQEAKLEVEDEPTLESFDYDDKKYRDALLSWKERSDKVKAQQDKIKQVEESQFQSYQQKVAAYHQAKTKLKVADIDEAENVVLETMSNLQQGIIVDVADNPALVIYALGSNPAKAKELAAITNPAIFAAKIGGLEKDLKVTPKKSPPPPEARVGKGSAPLSGAVDSQLERLRAKAKETGDITPVVRYQREKRKK